MLLRDLHPGGAKRDLSTLQAAALLRLIRPVTAVDVHRKAVARDLLADLRRLDTTIKASTAALSNALQAAGSTWTEVHGLGPVLAAKIIAHSGDVTRFPNRHHYASYCGAAPIEASSGDLRRHRLSREREHYQRKLTEAKTPAEARRSLKRQLSNVIYKRLLADHQRAAASMT